ncbi:hypothetical protein P262_04832 [Cronobacter malonaticus]|uniref:Uncharacterized protein n=1 Tax=Cronobacter malonaticus TaxID=413503 RepID=V5U357_9ENTR|nr:hypothetical protein P262_04832 [Cronobacter malonaticus]CCJ96331.1 hypothetical protein BN131_4004 [Cronobacter malonaticus 681]
MARKRITGNKPRPVAQRLPGLRATCNITAHLYKTPAKQTQPGYNHAWFFT